LLLTLLALIPVLSSGDYDQDQEQDYEHEPERGPGVPASAVCLLLI